jgi:abhydrolase domain-containing protein 6
MRLIACASVVALSSSCAPLLLGIAIDGERGHAGLDLKYDEAHGISYLERAPEKSAGVVVMLHGFGGVKDHFTRMCAEMPRDLRLIAIDIPGNGDSKRDASASYDFASQARRLHEFLRGLGIDHARIVGNSFGGQLAAVYGLEFPDDVDSLVLLDPSGIVVKPLPSIEVKTAADFDKQMAVVFVHQPEIPDVVKEYLAQQTVAAAPFNQKILDDVKRTPFELESRLPSMKPPTLVVWGAQDRVIDPSAAQKWRDLLPGHLVVVLSDTGHAPMIERPAETAELITVWWQRGSTP